MESMPLRFDPTMPLQSTPAFVRWTLALGCPLRETTDYFDPDQTERLLRGARCTSDAIAAGRVQNGIALQKLSTNEEPRGFAIEAVLEPLGGAEVVRQTCGHCRANAIAQHDPSALAGCIGHLLPPPGETDLWLSLALHERPTREVLIEQQERLARLSVDDVVGLTDYRLAIDTSLATELPLVVHAYPGGRCEGRRWYVEPHCGRCKSAWPEAPRQQCRVCGQVGGRQPERRRMRMGTRPYRPLREFLSESEIARLLQ
jgi:hypothetical protein